MAGPIESMVPEGLRRFPLWRGRWPIFYTVAREANGDPSWKRLDRVRVVECYKKNWCHLCARPMAAPYWFVIGPAEHEQKAVSTNGPMHEACARFAVAVCPFLNNPYYVSSTNAYDLADGVSTVLAMRAAGIDGHNVRSDRIVLCAAMTYRAVNLDQQFPEAVVLEWSYTDWDAVPSRERTTIGGAS